MMMNPSLPDKYLRDPNKSDEENEIQELFYRQYKTAHSELVMTSMNIYTWRERTIQFIHQYADEQIRILQDDFRRLDGLLQVNLRETLDTVRAYREVNDNDLFVQLRNECRQLKLQVAQLENVDSKMEFLRVTTIEEQRRREEQKKANADRPNSDFQVKQSETTVQNELNEGSSIDHQQRSVQLFKYFLFSDAPTFLSVVNSSQQQIIAELPWISQSQTQALQLVIISTRHAISVS
jgi:hypothetical protein